jgi:hypothetical protein
MPPMWNFPVTINDSEGEWNLLGELQMLSNTSRPRFLLSAILLRLSTFECRRFFGVFACVVLIEEIGNVRESVQEALFHFSV